MGNYPFLRVFFLCFSPPENLACNTKTLLSRVKSFLCVKETNRRKWRRGTKKKRDFRRKEYYIERDINYKSTFLFSFWLFGEGEVEIKQKMKPFGRIH